MMSVTAPLRLRRALQMKLMLLRNMSSQLVFEPYPLSITSVIWLKSMSAMANSASVLRIVLTSGTLPQKLRK